ncbi:MAG: hypothetical protein V1871_00975 [Planctomycetota bacterium]
MSSKNTASKRVTGLSFLKAAPNGTPCGRSASREGCPEKGGEKARLCGLPYDL